MAETHETDDGTVCHSPTGGTMETLSARYAMQIVGVVGAHGTIRFGDLEDHLPEASSSTLSARLDDLEAAGLLDRRAFDEVPPRVEYALTREGEALYERLAPVLAWAATGDAGDDPGDGSGPPGEGRGPPGEPGSRGGGRDR